MRITERILKSGVKRLRDRDGIIWYIARMADGKWGPCYAKTELDALQMKTGTEQREATMSKTTYTVQNRYGINCARPTHRSVMTALRHRDRMTGDGWMVVDSEGNEWTLRRGPYRADDQAVRL